MPGALQHKVNLDGMAFASDGSYAIGEDDARRVLAILSAIEVQVQVSDVALATLCVTQFEPTQPLFGGDVADDRRSLQSVDQGHQAAMEARLIRWYSGC